MKKNAWLSGPSPRRDRSNVLPLKGEIDLHVSPSVTALLNDMIERRLSGGWLSNNIGLLESLRNQCRE